jgi:hypothetical protein
MLALFLGGCYSPHFDEGLSLSIAFAKELEHVASFGPFYADESSTYGGYFLPDRVLFPSGGFWIKAYDGYLSAQYVMGSSVYGPRSTSSNTFGADAVTYPLSSAMSTPVSSVGKGLASIYASDLDGGVIAMGTDGGYQLNGILDLASSVTTSLTSPYYLLGASYTIPSSNPTMDTVSLLYASDAIGYQLEGAYFWLPNTSNLAPAVRALLPVNYPGPHLEPGAFFCWDNPHSRYFISGRRSTDGTVYSGFWDFGNLTSVPIEMPEVTSKLVAVLTTGELLARDATDMPLYDGDGTYETTLRTGSLRFVFEQLDGGTWYSYFTRAIRIDDQNNSNGRILVDVWRYPTEGLKSLGRP